MSEKNTKKITALSPTWQAPNNVRGFSTTRQGGFSMAPYDSFNLGDHVGDDKTAVKNNRTLLTEQLGLPQFPLFLNQTHSTKVIRLPYHGVDINADAVYTNQKNHVCLVMTADCLPLLFTNQQGTEVAAAHAGWRGLCDGIIEQTVQCFKSDPQDIMVWFAPAIGAKAFQVGQEVVDQFVAQDPQAISAFTPDPANPSKYFGDLYQLATQRLNKLGIVNINGGEHCTYHETQDFFSYRREGKTGRMASLIWFE